MSMINKEISDFRTYAYHENDFKFVSKEDILGKWSVFFFYPADFTFVCPTELEGFITALSSLTDQLTVKVCDREAPEAAAPWVEICRADGASTGLAFHGVPGGHEFTSFVLGLYNAAGPGQALDQATLDQIAAVTDKTDMKILVTLSCTMCPDLVVAAQRIAAANPNITAHVYDVRHFEGLKNRHQVMSVPCLVVNDEKVSFGKKNMDQVLAFLREG